MKMISAKQIKVIWSIWSVLKLDRDSLYEVINNLYGAEKMHRLTYIDAEDFIKAIKRRA